jgi:hypothetical protein
MEDDLGRKRLFILSSENSLDPEQLLALALPGKLLTVRDSEPDQHTLGVGSLGGATLDDEENDLIKKQFGGGLAMAAKSIPALVRQPRNPIGATG